MKKIKEIICLLIISIMVIGTIMPVTQAGTLDIYQGFDKGPSYTNVVSMKKVTMVKYDDESYLDDYAYLAAVPTAVFKDQDPNYDRLFSHPLLFYQEELEYEDDKERSLDAYQGVYYFMEDYMQYSNGFLDDMTLINLNENDILDEWKSKEYNIIESRSPFEIAKDLAISDWSYSDDAVLAVIDEKYEESDVEISDSFTDTLHPAKVKKETLEFDQLNQITPQFGDKDFSVPEGYQYIKANLWYPSFYIKPPLPQGLPPINITIPPGDPNLELFCKYKNEWMQVAATFGWNAVYGMGIEFAESYVYENGPWRISVTDVPTHETTTETGLQTEVHRNIGPLEFGRYGSLLQVLQNLKDTKYYVDVLMYPGIRTDLENNPPYGCRNATIKLTWDDPDAKLGFSLIGPGGEEVLSVSEENTDEQVMYLDQLGECLENENYAISVFTMDDVTRDIDFKIEYTFKQGTSEKKGDGLTSATEGAVLASQLNSPLLYTRSSSLPQATKDALYELGVEEIIMIDIGGHLNTETYDKLQEIAEIKHNYKELEPVYNIIREQTNSNDIVFTTLDPWTYWYVAERKPEGEYPGALFIGPAAYCAAHHGTPVLIVENHPQLSSSVVWHTEFWKRNEQRSGGVRALPSVAEMYLTGKRVYDFLKEQSFDEEGMENIITVAGKFDIGTPWDRTFFGKAASGRIFGSPVDTAYWISRNMFYPGLIFVNPATDQTGVKLIDGSSSKRQFPWWTKLGLKVYEESKEKIFTDPVLHTYLTYTHRFNERASDYWGWEYKCADGQIPGVSSTFNPIDNGVTGQEGCIFPDFSQTEVIPFYIDKGGYSNVFSTSFNAVMSNLNEGVILWMGSAHGGAGDSGTLDFWNADSPLTYESNPWRGYEWYLGSTDEPDTLTMENYGIIPMLFGNPSGTGLTGHGFFRTSIDLGLAKKPLLDIISKIANLPLINIIAPEWLKNSEDYYDGVVCSVLMFKPAVETHTGLEFDDALKNLHSVGVVNGACLVANKYLHLSLIRHGSIFQVLDPWPTSWYTTWTQFIPRNIALGQTIGEAFQEGISHVGILYINEPDPQWWADIKQNVCFFGDPALRPYVPGTDYGDENNWKKQETTPLRYSEDLSINGHMPYGATDHPHATKEKTFLEKNLFVFIIIVIIILLIIGLAVSGRKKRK
jgi:hypothetical protein